MSGRAGTASEWGPIVRGGARRDAIARGYGHYPALCQSEVRVTPR